MYADDIGLIAQANSFEQLEDTLNEDLNILQNYLFKLVSQPELQLKIGEINISNEECSKYLGVKLDRTLIFKYHLDSTKNKIKSRNNIIAKLAGTSWGCNASTLRTSALSLVFSITEYCTPVWRRSVQCKKIDVQLNVAMRIITGTVRSTPTQWLHIDPPEVRRQ